MFDLRKKNFIYKAVDLERIFPPQFISALNALFAIVALCLCLTLIKPGILGLSDQQVLLSF